MPNVRERAARLFDRDEAFRELCDEYRVCNETAVRMRTAAEADAALRNEYMALRLRLEAELLRYVAENRDE